MNLLASSNAAKPSCEDNLLFTQKQNTIKAQLYCMQDMKSLQMPAW